MVNWSENLSPLYGITKNMGLPKIWDYQKYGITKNKGLPKTI